MVAVRKADAAVACLEARLGLGNELPQDFDFLVHRRSAAVENLDIFLELEHPERDIQRLGVDRIRLWERHGNIRCAGRE